MEHRPWLKHYDADVPATLAPYPQKTLLDFVRETATDRPDHPFLLFKGARLTYGEVDRLSDAFAAALAARGVAKGERIALILPNVPQMVIAQLGAWKAGAIVHPLNPKYTRDELRTVLQLTSPVMAVVMTRFYDTLKGVQPDTSVRSVIATSVKEYLPPMLRVLFTLFKEKKEGDRITLQPGDEWFQACLRDGAARRRLDVSIEGDHPALLLCTGGTTGVPKAAIQTHRALVMTGMQVVSWTRGLVPDWTSTVMLAMPLFHTYGNTLLLSVVIVSHNTAALVPNPRDINDLLATVQKVRPTALPAMPALYIKLLEHPRVKAGKVNLSSIKACMSGAAPLLAETKRRFEDVTGGRVFEGYALTESCCALTSNPLQGLYKIGSVGIPAPDVEVRIVDAESGRTTLPVGEIGELVMRAPNLMAGYWGAPQETKETLRDGWLYTGDLAYMDEDGYTFIVDRKKDLVKPSGFQVWPREVEEVIAAHPSVVEVAVAGVPDPVQGEAVKAWVVVKLDTHVGAEDLRELCRKRLAAYKVPKHIEFRDELPKTPLGKMLRRTLRNEDAKRQAPSVDLSGHRCTQAVRKRERLLAEVRNTRTVFTTVTIAMLDTPLTYDPTRWFAWRTGVVVVLIAALAYWGFRNVLGRQSAFPEGTLEG